VAVIVPLFLVTGILGWIWLSHRRKHQRRLRHKKRGRRRGSTTHSTVSRWGPYQVVRVPVSDPDRDGDISQSGSHPLVYVSRSNSHRAGHIPRTPSHRRKHSTKHRRRSSGHGRSKPVVVENEASHEPPQEAPAPVEAVEAARAPTPPEDEPTPPPPAP
jgi:hypothetical protein